MSISLFIAMGEPAHIQQCFSGLELATFRPGMLRFRGHQQILSKRNPGRFNSLQITNVASRRFLGVPYITAFAHWRHIQESMFLSRGKRLTEWDRANSIPADTF